MPVATTVYTAASGALFKSTTTEDRLLPAKEDVTLKMHRREVRAARVAGVIGMKFAMNEPQFYDASPDLRLPTETKFGSPQRSLLFHYCGTWSF
jgi:hypothetical protein